MDSPCGVDGYRLRKNEDEASILIWNDLILEESTRLKKYLEDHPCLVAEPPVLAEERFTLRQRAGLILAGLRRMKWLKRNRRWREGWTDLVCGLLWALSEHNAVFIGQELSEALKMMAGLKHPMLFRRAYEMCLRAIDSETATPGVYDAAWRIVSAIEEDVSVQRQTGDESRWAWQFLLWFDNSRPLHPSDCWSQCVRSDIARMGPEAHVWATFFSHMLVRQPHKWLRYPPEIWNKKAGSILSAIPSGKLRRKIESWFRRFDQPDPVPLSEAGAHILRCLAWYGTVSNDAGLHELLLRPLDVEWVDANLAGEALLPYVLSLPRLAPGRVYDITRAYLNRFVSRGIRDELTTYSASLGLNRDQLIALGINDDIPDFTAEQIGDYIHDWAQALANPSSPEANEMSDCALDPGAQTSLKLSRRKQRL